MRRYLHILAVALLFVPCLAWADGFDEVIRSLTVDRPDATTQVITGSLYGARVNATIKDADGNNDNFKNADQMSALLVGRTGKSLSFTGNKEQFDQFVKDNAATIRDIIFPGGIATEVVGIDESQTIALLTFDNLVAPTLSPRESALRRGLVSQLLPLREVGALVDFERFKVEGTKGISYKFAPSYNFSIGRFEGGLGLPMKFTDLDDSINTDAYNIGLDLHGAYPIALEREWAVYVLGGSFVNALVFTSDALEVAGYLRYGGFFGGSAKATLGPVILSGGATYNLSKLDVPDSLVTDDIREIVQAIEDRPIDQQLVFGANLAIPITPNIAFNVRATRTETIGASAIEDGKQHFTRLQGTVSLFLGQSFALDLGYGQIFGAKGLQSQNGLIFTRYNF